MRYQSNNNNQGQPMSIIRHDRVTAIKGHFKGRKGYVTRVDSVGACVVWNGVWSHGIWTPLLDLKRTKRYKKEQEKE